MARNIKYQNYLKNQVANMDNYHNAAYSDKKLSLFNKENSPKCKYCGEDDEDIKHKLNKFKSQIPNTPVIHALALWEIHRAKTEYNMSNINLSDHQMFSRWKINLKNQIIMDWCNVLDNWSTSKISAEQWTKTITKWFYIEPDGYNKENIVFK
ncbi:hypothetical protein BB561_003677 [Smittium simulii]|uniref:Uncharacterized protein n=1 Tax=Smittium simulii TaxID=133385 RepID=A0A2T9YK45_9FUNG|nr:hypothetical protein BB561_003677 [Smittium simulii]